MCQLIAMILCWVLLAPLPGVDTSCRSEASTRAPGATPAMTEVFAGMDWYRARPEPEEEYRGTLRRREVVAGPAARTALRYNLVTETVPFAVYAPEHDQTLEPYVGHSVAVRAKLVNLTAEGFGIELWIGAIASLDRR